MATGDEAARASAGGAPAGPRREAPAAGRPILVPLDGSALAERALPYAVAEAQRRAVPLRLLRVVSPGPIALGGVAAASLDELAAPGEQEQAERYLTDRGRALAAGAPGLDVRVEVRRGDPATELLDAARRDAVQLVVLTTHGRSGLTRLVRGSIAEAVVAHGTAPTLLIRAWDAPAAPAPPGAAPAAGRRVLAALDGAPPAEGVLPEACRLAGLGGEVLLVTVVAPSGGSGSTRAVGAARAYLDRLAAGLRARGLGARTAVPVAADVAGAIRDVARRDGAALVALRTHGRGPFGRWRHGSVADEVTRVSPVPVLLYHPASREGGGAADAPAAAARDPEAPRGPAR
jgi:nucleotide-binding universal stress UspA family protein